MGEVLAFPYSNTNGDLGVCHHFLFALLSPKDDMTVIFPILTNRDNFGAHLILPEILSAGIVAPGDIMFLGGEIGLASRHPSVVSNRIPMDVIETGIVVGVHQNVFEQATKPSALPLLVGLGILEVVIDHLKKLLDLDSLAGHFCFPFRWLDTSGYQ
jgi:hypothetical protein